MKNLFSLLFSQLKLPFSTVAETEALIPRLEYLLPASPAVTILGVGLLVGVVLFFSCGEHGTEKKWQRPLRFFLRLGALATLLLMLSELMLSQERVGKPYLTLVLDTSASMNYDDAAPEYDLLKQTTALENKNSRLTKIKAHLLDEKSELIDSLKKRYRLTLLTTSELSESRKTLSVKELKAKIKALSSDDSLRPKTPLGNTIREAITRLPSSQQAAILLFSDGNSNAGHSLSSAAKYAASQQIPVYTVGVGSNKPRPDLNLHDLLHEKVAFVKDAVQFNVRLKSIGFEGAKARVLLRDEKSNKILAEKLVLINPQQSERSLQLSFTPTQPGRIPLLLEVEPLQGELKLENNQLRSYLEVRDIKIRVLLADRIPRYEFRYLKHTLEHEPTIQLSTYLQEGDPAYTALDPAGLAEFPETTQKLLAYDVVIFGDLDPALLPTTTGKSLKDFVSQKGGGFIGIAGQGYFPQKYLAQLEIRHLLPVDTTKLSSQTITDATGRGLKFSPTSLGQQMPPLRLEETLENSASLWHSFPEIYWWLAASQLKPATQVWIEGHPALQNQPTKKVSPVKENPAKKTALIMFHHYGSGKVLFHAFDTSWRWRTLRSDLYFNRYWIQTIHQMARGKTSSSDAAVKISSDQPKYHTGETVYLRVKFQDSKLLSDLEQQVTLLLSSPQSPDQILQLQRRLGHENLYETTLADLPAANYQVNLSSPMLKLPPQPLFFSVNNHLLEYEHLALDQTALEKIATQTHGKYFHLEQLDQHLLLASLPAERQVTIEKLFPQTLWNHWSLLLLFLTFLISEWLLRKKVGLT